MNARDCAPQRVPVTYKSLFLDIPKTLTDAGTRQDDTHGQYESTVYWAPAHAFFSNGGVRYPMSKPIHESQTVACHMPIV